MTIPQTTGTPAPSVVATGVKTSEFWLTVVTLIIYAVTSFLPADMVQKWGDAHGWLGGLVVVVYIAARTYVKAVRLKAGV